MMLNERQKQIFLCLDENKNSFIKGIELANKVNCSLKTLQNTVKRDENNFRKISTRNYFNDKQRI